MLIYLNIFFSQQTNIQVFNILFLESLTYDFAEWWKFLHHEFKAKYYIYTE